METDVTIIDNNLSINILNKYTNYKIIDKSFNYNELIEYKNIVFFNNLNYLNDNQITQLFDYLKVNNVNFINITNNIEQAILTEKIIIMNNGEVIVSGNSKEILCDEKLLRKMCLKIPFYVELSGMLKNYNLLDKIYLSKDEIRGKLWK